MKIKTPDIYVISKENVHCKMYGTLKDEKKV